MPPRDRAARSCISRCSIDCDRRSGGRRLACPLLADLDC
jgi:hypothetical protein